MAGDQDAGLSLLPMRKARPHAAGKALAAGDAFDGCTHDRHLPRCKVEHALDRASIPGRAFAFHPAAQTLQHDLGIKGKVGWVHGGYSRFLMECSWQPSFTRMNGAGFVKRKHAAE